MSRGHCPPPQKHRTPNHALSPPASGIARPHGWLLWG